MNIKSLIIGIVAFVSLSQTACGQWLYNPSGGTRVQITEANRILQGMNELARLERERQRREREQQRKEKRDKEITQLAQAIMLTDGKHKGLLEYKQLLVTNATRYGQSEEQIVRYTSQTVALLKNIDSRYTNMIVLELMAKTKRRRDSYRSLCQTLIYKVREVNGKI